MRFIHAALMAFGLVASGCAGLPRQAADATLIVVSLDGFRADYVSRGKTPTIAALSAAGVHASAMRPSFPSVTMPNHYTLVTGLYPDRHGIVDNTMRDPAIPGWFGVEPKVEDDPRWWNGATPLWVTAEKAGIRSGAVAWPGAAVAIRGTLPSQVAPYAPDFAPAAEVATALGWLDQPEGRRPRLLLLHFSPVDEAGHAFGPDSPQVDAALGEVDAALAALVDGLKARGLYDRTNLVLLSDHGMTGVSLDRVVLIDDFVDVAKLDVTTYGAEIGVNPAPGHEAEVEKAMLAPHEHLTCWRKGEIPRRLHYGANPRVPAIFCLAENGWIVVTRAIGEAALRQMPEGLKGNHGYDPALPDMAALFVAHGPAFRSGVTLAPFDNVDVYPILARLLGLPPEPGDGTPAPLTPALR
ncbi:MAG: alkaline phosphatase family protein [Alphaproteobacteria bacterium]|nr:alkaline phosphatase family protein [Alphaproteobacteria bacterium]